ncbi:zinc metallopeptidase [Mollicutes bacterium LVI A0039]|nr:zinc metallopeptidase [Mollicutes bacterium LVI A0039]
MQFIILIAIIGLPLWAQKNIMSVIGKYSRVAIQNGMTGREVAEYILNYEGITDVRVQAIGGSMTDNFNPQNKTVNLSQTVYASKSIAAACIAAHEVGHAIQHHQGYSGLVVRNLIFPFARTGGQLAAVTILLGLISGFTGLFTFGIICLTAILLFQVATLPVEYNASDRALEKLEHYGLLTSGELNGASKVLRAAALTYLMAAISTFLNIIRLVGLARD